MYRLPTPRLVHAFFHYNFLLERSVQIDRWLVFICCQFNGQLPHVPINFRARFTTSRKLLQQQIRARAVHLAGKAISSSTRLRCYACGLFFVLTLIRYLP